MKQKLLFLASYAGLLPIFIVALILYSLYLLHASDQNHQNLYGFTPIVHYQALPTQKEVSSVEVDPEDARIQVLTEFFQDNHSPLVPYAQHIVEDADKYGLDYRLVPSIAMQESTLCRTIPKNSYNCWGFGIYTGHVTRFPDYGTAIDTVSKSLAQDYKDKGYTTPALIMTKYTPSSNGSWANGVNTYMSYLKSEL